MPGSRIPLLALLLAASLVPACVGIPVDGGYPDDGYRTYPDYDYDDDYADRAIWQRQHRRVSCSEIEQRIRYDREKIAEIPPGRHKKARQWYIDDIRNAERDLQECRGDRRQDWDDWRDRRRDDAREREAERQREIDRRRQARAECDKIRERIRFNQAKIAEIEPGRHKKARQWYVDDIRNAERDLAKCRGR